MKKGMQMNREVEIKLYQLLIKNKMTYKELSDKIGVSVGTISAMVNNKTERIPKSLITKIANVFELDDIRDLIDFKKDQ